MFAKWPIRLKLLIGLALLLAVVVSLSSSGLYATYSYRSLVKGLSWRSIELPTAAAISARVWELRSTLSEIRGIRAGSYPLAALAGERVQVQLVRGQFSAKLDEVEQLVGSYRQLLNRKLEDDSSMADNQPEWFTLHQIEDALRDVRQANRDEEWMLYDSKVDRLDEALDNLQQLTAALPNHLHRTFAGFSDAVKGQYRALIFGTWTGSIVAALIFALFVRLFYRWIFAPLRILIDGSRQVAAGRFHYRIHLATDDEMAELAEALNQMTARFQAIRDDLDRQVQERTKQVIRNEELASVGFLAAGVAHEINNPLASIALCAESLESRTRGLLDPHNADHAVIAHYLRMIQDEAFRCKEITEKLLDFSRIGEVRRQDTDLGELVAGVIDMLRRLGKYQNKRIEFAATEPLFAPVNAREIKQVVLNLLSNALDCVDQQGLVRITLKKQDGQAELTVADDGCGMEPEVLDRVFEPFFTRRKAGQGTGLGLSITHRIVADHGGEIVASSPGLGQGSTFRVCLPLVARLPDPAHQQQAA